MGLTWAKPSSILWWVLYYFISAVLLFSGVSKIIDPVPMIETMKATFRIDESFLIFAATGLPIIEIALGLMLVFKVQTKKTLLATLLLFFGFFVFSIYGTAIGLNNNCGCFGGGVKSEFGMTMILRNLILTFLNIRLYYEKILFSCY